MEQKKNLMIIGGELANSNIKKKKILNAIGSTYDYGSTMVSKNQKSQIRIRSIRFQSQKTEDSQDLRQFSSTGIDMMGNKE